MASACAPKRKPVAIARAVSRVLTEPSFRAAAEKMAAQLREDVAAGRLRTALEQLGAKVPGAGRLIGPSYAFKGLVDAPHR